MVAVCGPRSFGLVAGVMAVLLAGGVLLTVDRALPANRRRLITQEANARYAILVGEGQPAEEWTRGLPLKCIVGVQVGGGLLEEGPGSAEPDALPLPQPTAEDPAYIFFTSGTTGVPKGVLGWHKGLSHFLAWQRASFGVGPGDRVAQLSSLSFDVVLRDLFLPLTSGAALYLPDEEIDMVPDRVMRWLDEQDVSVLHVVPSLAYLWLGELAAEASLRSLRWAFFAGEPLADGLVRRWRERFPQSGQVVNLYGPTETTLVKCFYVVPADVPPGIQPLGWPLPGAQALVLSANGGLCGVSEPGRSPAHAVPDPGLHQRARRADETLRQEPQP